MGNTWTDQLAVQLYTVRHKISRDLRGTLASIAEMGWPAVEVAGFEYEVDALVDALKASHLRVAGLHADLNRLQNDLSGVLNEAKRLGTKDVILPWLDVLMRSPNGFRTVRTLLNTWAEVFTNEGLRLSYHNHAFEFETVIDGQDGLSYLLQSKEESSIYAEFDVYWLAKSGRDPATFMSPYQGRISNLHLKDMSADDRQTFAAIGTGVIDFASVLRLGAESNVTWYVVEQDECPGDPLDSLQISWNNLRDLMRSI